MWYPGQEVGNAIGDVLFGKADPGGRLPQSFPHALEHNPAFLNYPGEAGKVRYGEGIYIGYRYYEKTKRAVLFPFGHGLSYAKFRYDNPQLAVNTASEVCSVSLNVTNISDRAGQEVVQVYISHVAPGCQGPIKELENFEKVRLEPGERGRFGCSLRDLTSHCSIPASAAGRRPATAWRWLWDDPAKTSFGGEVWYMAASNQP